MGSDYQSEHSNDVNDPDSDATRIDKATDIDDTTQSSLGEFTKNATEDPPRPDTVDTSQNQPSAAPTEDTAPDATTSQTPSNTPDQPKTTFADWDPNSENTATSSTGTPPAEYADSDDDWTGYQGGERTNGPDQHLEDEQRTPTVDTESVSDWSNQHFGHQADTPEPHQPDTQATDPARVDTLESDGYGDTDGRVNPTETPEAGDVLRSTDEPDTEPGTVLRSEGPGVDNISRQDRMDVEERGHENELFAGGSLGPDASYEDTLPGTTTTPPQSAGDPQRFGIETQRAGTPLGSHQASLHDEHIQDDTDLITIERGSGTTETMPRPAGASLAAQERKAAELQEAITDRQHRKGAMQAWGQEKWRAKEQHRAQQHNESADSIVGDQTDPGPSNHQLGSPSTYTPPWKETADHWEADYDDTIERGLKQQLPDDSFFTDPVDKITQQTDTDRATVKKAFMGQLLKNDEIDTFEKGLIATSDGTTRGLAKVDLDPVETSKDLRKARDATIAQLNADQNTRHEETGMYSYTPEQALGTTEGTFGEYNRGQMVGEVTGVVENTTDNGHVERVVYLSHPDSFEDTPDVKVSVFDSHNSPTFENEQSVYGYTINEMNAPFDAVPGDTVQVDGKFTAYQDYGNTEAHEKGEATTQLSIHLTKESTYSILDRNQARRQRQTTGTGVSEADVVSPDAYTGRLTELNVPVETESDQVADAKGDAGGSTTEAGPDSPADAPDSTDLSPSTEPAWVLPNANGSHSTSSTGITDTDGMLRRSTVTNKPSFTEYELHRRTTPTPELVSDGFDTVFSSD